MLEIAQEILILTKESNLKTPILYGANLNYRQLKKYLDFLIDKALLDRFEIDGKLFYQTTEKGFCFLESYLDLKKLLNSDALPIGCQFY